MQSKFSVVDMDFAILFFLSFLPVLILVPCVSKGRIKSI